VRNLERAGVPRSAAMKLGGHKTESIYRRYAITERGHAPRGRLEALGPAQELGQSRVKSDALDAPELFAEASVDEKVGMEAASGLEPEIEVLQGKRKIQTNPRQTL
jgi:hypothetical protein